jgi:hypothetical protein
VIRWLRQRIQEHRDAVAAEEAHYRAARERPVVARNVERVRLVTWEELAEALNDDTPRADE